MKLIVNFIKRNIYIVAIFIILSVFTNLFFNIYAIQIRKIDERMMRAYGFGCEKWSYGFIKKIKNNYLDDKKVFIESFESMPPVISLFEDLKVDNKKENLILLNLKKKTDIKKININIKDYELIESLNNCYFYKKK